MMPAGPDLSPPLIGAWLQGVAPGGVEIGQGTLTLINPDDAGVLR